MGVNEDIACRIARDRKQLRKVTLRLEEIEDILQYHFDDIVALLGEYDNLLIEQDQLRRKLKGNHDNIKKFNI